MARGSEAYLGDARQRRGLCAEGGYRSPRERILEAVLAIAECDAMDEVAWHRAWCLFHVTMKDTGWTPPPEGEAEEKT